MAVLTKEGLQKLQEELDDTRARTSEYYAYSGSPQALGYDRILHGRFELGVILNKVDMQQDRYGKYGKYGKYGNYGYGYGVYGNYGVSDKETTALNEM